MGDTRRSNVAAGRAIGEGGSEESAQQIADALKEAAQQPKDAGQEATYCTAEAAEDSHPQLLFRLPRYQEPRHRTGLRRRHRDEASGRLDNEPPPPRGGG